MKKLFTLAAAISTLTTLSGCDKVDVMLHGHYIQPTKTAEAINRAITDHLTIGCGNPLVPFEGGDLKVGSPNRPTIEQQIPKSACYFYKNGTRIAITGLTV